MSVFEGKVLFVCVDSDEDEYFYVADADAVDAYYEEHPNADRFEVATTIGRDLTDEERAALPEISGALAY